jgi:hypothetical protein
MKSIIAPLLVAFALAPTTDGLAQQLDQSNFIITGGGFVSDTISSVNQLSQTFTAGKSGLLTEVDLQLLVVGDPSQFTSDMTLTLSRLPSLSFPVGVTLATTTLHLANIPRPDNAGIISSFRMPIYFAAPPVVGQGQFFSLTLTSAQPYSTSNFYTWVMEQALSIDHYAPGDAWRNANLAGWNKDGYLQDFGFETFVTPVPEPSALSILVVAAGIFAFRRRRKTERHSVTTNSRITTS